MRVRWAARAAKANPCLTSWPASGLPNGLLPSRQVRAIANVADRYARGVADLTVRQNVQLHWLTIEQLPDVLENLWRAGLTTMGSCGDDTRNITGCPLAGIDGEEICDASPLVLEATRLLVGNPDFYNLPRKFKICITGCPVWCSYPEINDVGLTAVTRSLNGRPEVGFSLRVGGGLSTDPLFAQRLNAFVRWDQVIPVITRRDRNLPRRGRPAREPRARPPEVSLPAARVDRGELPGELERRIGFELDPAVEEAPPADIYRDHVGIHAQKQPGYSYVGAAVLRGRIKARATPCRCRSCGPLRLRRTAHHQHAEPAHHQCPQPSGRRAGARVGRHRTAAGGSSFARGAIACTGTEFCKLAITETKTFTRWLVEELEERLPEFDQPLKLNVTGCPNSCGQHWIADVGIEGKKIKVDGKLADAYYFCVGGAVGQPPRLRAPRRLPLRSHRGSRTPLSACCAPIWTSDFKAKTCATSFARHRDEELRAFLAGAEMACRRPRSFARTCSAWRGGVILSSRRIQAANTTEKRYCHHD